MQVRALASGSSGNAYVLQSGSTHLLLEAGLTASRLSTFLNDLGLSPALLDGILLTHAHSDHCRGAREFSDRFDVPIYATAGTLGQRPLRTSRLARPVQSNRALSIDDLEVVPFAVPHDCVEPVGYRISGEEGTVCLTTDLGFVPDSVLPYLQAADLLVVEANHDEEMLWSGPYPPFLKRRVAGEFGHLSNAAAAKCLVDLERRPPGEIWLAHLSAVNNHAAHATRAARETLAMLGLEHVPVSAVGRNIPSLAWSTGPLEKQLQLF